VLSRLGGWFEVRFDPVAQAAGPPPGGLYRFARWALAGAGPAIALLAIVSVLSGIAEVAAALILGWVIDRATAGGTGAFFAENAVWLLLAGAFFLLVRPLLLAFGAALTGLSINPGLLPLTLIRLHRHTLGQPIAFFEDDFAGRISQKQMQAATALTSVVSEGCNSLLFGLAAAVGAVLMLGHAGPWLALILLLWIAAYAALVRHFLPRIRAQSGVRAAARAAMTGQIVDTVSNMATVKLFAHAAREEGAAREAIGSFRAAALGFGRLAARFRFWLMLLAGALPVALIGAALLLWSRGAASPGDIAVAGMISTRLAQMSGWLSFTAMEIFSNIGEIEDGIRTLSPPHRIADRPGAIEPRRARGAIRFESVTFRYGRGAGEGRGALDRFSLDIRPGEKVALVGRSGAGKSTALALLLRLYETESGRVLLDGQDIRGLTQDGLRRQIAMVRQDTAMFNRSALDNILYGNPDATPEAAIEAARLAEADGFIRGLRDRSGREGYAAFLGERGVKLSGGQRQRIALARAILKDAPVLALDEATSALDSETEAAVQRALGRLMAGKTVIAVAHRLSTIAHMDRIVVMEAGRVAEEGTHAALLARGGLYAAFWARQSGGFIGVEAAE
jgi:ATP-binding cassette subfamily B protein